MIRNSHGKSCSKCRRFKPYSEYGRDTSHKDSYRSACKKCDSRQKGANNKARTLRERANLPMPTNFPAASSQQALERHLKDFQYKLTHIAPVRRLDAPYLHKKGLQFYRQGGTMEGQAMVKMQVPDGEYVVSLGLWNVGRIVEFFWSYDVEIIYEVPETPKKTG